MHKKKRSWIISLNANHYCQQQPLAKPDVLLALAIAHTSCMNPWAQQQRYVWSIYSTSIANGSVKTGERNKCSVVLIDSVCCLLPPQCVASCLLLVFILCFYLFYIYGALMSPSSNASSFSRLPFDIVTFNSKWKQIGRGNVCLPMCSLGYAAQFLGFCTCFALMCGIPKCVLRIL